MITYRPVTRYLCRRSHRPCPKGCARPHPSVQWYFCSPFENCINNGRLTKHIMIHCVSISLTDKSWFKIISVSIYILYNIYGSYKANHSQNQSEERHSGRSSSPKIHVRAHPPRKRTWSEKAASLPSRSYRSPWDLSLLKDHEIVDPQNCRSNVWYLGLQDKLAFPELHHNGSRGS